MIVRGLSYPDDYSFNTAGRQSNFKGVECYVLSEIYQLCPVYLNKTASVFFLLIFFLII